MLRSVPSLFSLRRSLLVLAIAVGASLLAGCEIPNPSVPAQTRSDPSRSERAHW
jgi:hypothetical protein